MPASVRPSVRICTGHKFYIYAWISKVYDTVVILEEEKCHLKYVLGRLKVKVIPEGHINQLVRAITPTFMHEFHTKLHRRSS